MTVVDSCYKVFESTLPMLVPFPRRWGVKVTIETFGTEMFVNISSGSIVVVIVVVTGVVVVVTGVVVLPTLLLLLPALLLLLLLLGLTLSSFILCTVVKGCYTYSHDVEKISHENCGEPERRRREFLYQGFS